jgi:pyridoxamine 5'-phosphate oxidase
VLQPHAATWSTVDADGAPSSRTLILKDLTAEGFWFATPSDSPMGRDLAGNAGAALHLYWRELGRQLRVTGSAAPGAPEISHADWAARSPSARAEANPETWTAYLLRPTAIEFFAASASRSHLRLRYRRVSDGSWIRERLAA